LFNHHSPINIKHDLQKNKKKRAKTQENLVSRINCCTFAHEEKRSLEAKQNEKE
jgi:hypothetical protein